MTLADIKRHVQRGQVYDVTNHYITRADHACYGTVRRTVTRTTSTRIYLSHPTRGESEVTWPKADQVTMDDQSVIRLYGGGKGQQSHDLFLTLTPVCVLLAVSCWVSARHETTMDPAQLAATLSDHGWPNSAQVAELLASGEDMTHRQAEVAQLIHALCEIQELLDVGTDGEPAEVDAATDFHIEVITRGAEPGPAGPAQGGEAPPA